MWWIANSVFCVHVCVQWMAVGVNGVNGRHAEPTAACGGVENVPNLRLAPVGRNARAWIFSPSTVPASNALRVSTTTSVPWLIHRLNDRLPLLITLNVMWSLGCISERPFTARQRGKNEERAPWRLALTHLFSVVQAGFVYRRLVFFYREVTFPDQRISSCPRSWWSPGFRSLFVFQFFSPCTTFPVPVVLLFF